MARKSKFRKKVANNTQKQRTAGTSYGHLNLPKGLTVFKEKPGGKALLDFLPYVVTDENHMDRDVENGIAVPGNQDTDLWYKKPYRLHRNIGSENKSVVCPSTWGKKCPICEYKAAKLKDGAEYDEVRDLKPTLRNLYIVVPLGMKEFKEVPHVWDFSQFLFQEMLNEELDEDEDYCVFPDLEEGLSLRIRFNEKKFMNNSFAETSRIDFEERANQYEESMLDDIPCLDDIITCPSYEAVEALFMDMAEPTDEEETTAEEESQEEEPKRPLQRKKKTTRREPEPEPGPEEEPEPGPEEDDCRACGGSGINSRGGECRPCKGSGKKQVKAEPKAEQAKPTRRKKPVEKEPTPAPKKPSKQQTANECPFAYKFGVDTDQYEDCDECEKWDECIEAKEAS